MMLGSTRCEFTCLMSWSRPHVSAPTTPHSGSFLKSCKSMAASMKSQFDAFAEYVVEAERNGTEQYPLYQWTKATIEDPAKKQKHLKSFSLHVKGRELYSKDEADALEADLETLVGGGVITRISKHDSNPEHNPQMPERYRKRQAGEAGPND